MLHVGGVEAELPVVINNYKFQEMIGRGGFGAVYRCLNITYDIEFAAKVLPVSSASATESFASEIDALTKLDHPNVIKLYNHFEFEGQLILILELCDSGSVKTKIVNGLEWQQFIYYATQILDGISCIHGQRIAHRDIKPANLLLNERGKVKVSDFGISAEVKGQMTDFMGSLFFMAPEMLEKRKDYDPFAADIYALGITFFHMITGTLPWTGSTREEVRKQIKLGCIDLTAIKNPGLKAALKKMLALDPRERPRIGQIKQMSVFQVSVGNSPSRGGTHRVSKRFVTSSLSGSSITPSRSGVENALIRRLPGNSLWWSHMKPNVIKPISITNNLSL